MQRSGVSACRHSSTVCLNQYELIRKYRCLTCGAVMMCACDEARGRKFLPHQLREGVELETQERVPVNAGFRPNICSECKGLRPEAHPTSAIPGRTSKIRRYYWRELWFREQEIVATEVADPTRAQLNDGESAASDAEKRASTRALEEIKQLHKTSPKYRFNEESQHDVIERYSVDVIALNGIYAAGQADERARVLVEGSPVSVEQYATIYFQRRGYSVLRLESRPFHVLFGVYMWLLIQDPGDPENMTVGFVGRAKDKSAGSKTWMLRPRDFGTVGYAARRAKNIAVHLEQIAELEWLFDYWLAPSSGFRQYLWADQPDDIGVARELIKVLPRAKILEILSYLVGNYWGRYLGWPDLILHRDAEVRLVEVKSSADKLSENQKRWIADNHHILKLPFSIVKIHKKSIL